MNDAAEHLTPYEEIIRKANEQAIAQAAKERDEKQARINGAAKAMTCFLVAAAGCFGFAIGWIYGPIGLLVNVGALCLLMALALAAAIWSEL